MAVRKSQRIPQGEPQDDPDGIAGTHVPDFSAAHLQPQNLGATPLANTDTFVEADAATIAPVTADRFNECAQRLSLEFREEGNNVIVGTDGMFLAFSVPKSDGHFTEGVCRVPIHSDNPDDKAIFATEDPVPSTFDLQQVANQWNAHYLQPTVVFTKEHQRSVFILHARFFIQAGVTNHQLDQMVTRALNVCAQAVTTLPGMLTPTVTETE